MNSPAESRQFFERLVAGGRADASVYLGLANACAALDDRRAALAAVDQALLLQPRNLRALIVKADQLAAIGDDRSAASFYRAAVAAAPAPQEMPAELRDDLARASALSARYAAAFETHLRQWLADRQLDEPGNRSAFCLKGSRATR